MRRGPAAVNGRQGAERAQRTLARRGRCAYALRSSIVSPPHSDELNQLHLKPFRVASAAVRNETLEISGHTKWHFEPRPPGAHRTCLCVGSPRCPLRDASRCVPPRFRHLGSPQETPADTGMNFTRRFMPHVRNFLSGEVAFVARTAS
jgi:hypothetical protein